MDEDEKYLSMTIDLAKNNVRNGGGPFGAILVNTKKEVFESVNKVTENNDPTAHAEIQVIRLAASTLKTHNLSDFVLYSSCEPCPMCFGASLWSRISRVVFAADRFDAQKAGFDDAIFYETMKRKNELFKKIDMKNKTEPFQEWENFSEKKEY